MSEEIEGRVKRYQSRAIGLAILVHFLIIFTGIVTLVVLRQPLLIFIITHATIQAAAIANAVIGPTIYRRYLLAKSMRRLDIA
jgi:hypothetical protein